MSLCLWRDLQVLRHLEALGITRPKPPVVSGALQAHGPGEHLGDHLIEGKGDFLLELDVGMQGTRQWRSIQDRHGMRLPELANAQRHLITSLGHHAWRAHVRLAIDQRHREMGRIGDDDVRSRHLRHHACPRHCLLLLTNARLDLRVAIRLLVLTLDLFETHAQLLGMAP